eukprot:3040866-Pleurochrysis_carterae.AAC.1
MHRFRSSQGHRSAGFEICLSADTEVTTHLQGLHVLTNPSFRDPRMGLRRRGTEIRSRFRDDDVRAMRLRRCTRLRLG